MGGNLTYLERFVERLVSKGNVLNLLENVSKGFFGYK